MPFWDQYTSYNALGNNKWGSLLPGTNKEQQMQNLWLIGDPKVFRETLRTALDEMWEKSPLAAMEFAQAAMQYGTSDIFLNNAFGLVDIATSVPYGVMARWGWKAIPKKAPTKVEWSTPKIEDAGARPKDWETPTLTDLGPNYGTFFLKDSSIEPVQMDFFKRWESNFGQGDLFPGTTPGAGRAPTLGDKIDDIPPVRRGAGGRMQSMRDAKERMRGETELENTEGFPGRPEVRDRPLDKEGKPQEGYLFDLPSRDIFPRQDPTSGRIQRQKGPGFGEPKQVEMDLRQGDFQRSLELKSPDAEIKKSMIDTIKATKGPIVDPEEILSGIGDTSQAAKFGATRSIVSIIKSMDPLEEGTGFLSKLPPLFRPGAFFDDAKSLSAALKDQLVQEALRSSEHLLAAITNPTRASRLTEAEIAPAVTEAAKKIKEEFNPHSSGVLRVVDNGWHESTNTRSVSLHLGKPDKSLFSSKESANNFAQWNYKIDPDDFLIQQQGNSFYINIVRPVTETTDAVRDLLYQAKKGAKYGPIETFLQRYINPDISFTKAERAQRKTVIHGRQAMRQMVAAEGDAFKGLSRLERGDLNTILRMNRDFYDPKTGDRGMFYKTAGELERAYLQRHKRMPSEAELRAYDQYTRLSDFDWVLRNLGWHRDKVRLGIMNHRWTMKGGDGTPMKTEYFEGRTADILDWGNTGEKGIWFHDSKTGSGQFIYKNDLRENVSLRGHIDRLINDEGYKIVEIFAPADRPLKNITGHGGEINYVITNTFEQKRLKWGQGIEYRPGGHVVYQNPWFIKQAIVKPGNKGSQTYYGDVTLRGDFRNEKEAREWAAKYEEGRRLYKAVQDGLTKREDVSGAEAALDRYVAANLPDTTKEFKALFRDDLLDINNPISVSYSGRSVIESNPEQMKELYTQFKDQIAAPSNLANALDRTFLGDRGPPLQRNKNVGSEANPIYKLENGDVIDPFPSLEQGLAQAMRSRYMVDYKISAAEHWVAEFGALLERPLEQIAKNPLYHLYNTPINPAMLVNPSGGYKDKALHAKARAAETARRNIINLLGSRSEMGQEMAFLERLLVDNLSAGKQKWVYDHPHAIAAIRDPFAYMRAAAFHSKLGIFNPAQWLLQSQSMAHVTAVAGFDSGMKGYSGMFVARYLRMTESDRILAHGADILKPWGWKKEDFLEAYNAMRNSGFDIVGGESGWLDNMYEPTVFQSAGRKFLDKGSWFFRAGETNTRMSAWFAAYHEWRKVNPGKNLDQTEVGNILDRADAMSVRMTATSKANWEQGIASIPSQFMTFQLRMAQQFLGEMTGAERRRMVGIYTTLYGIPVGMSTPFAFLPLYDSTYGDIRLAAEKEGLNVNASWFKAAHEGILSMALSWAGIDTNVARRMGPQGQSILREVFWGEKSVTELVAGPSGKILTDIAGSTWSLASNMWGTLGGENNFTVDDFLDPLLNISTMNNLRKAYIGATLGVYLSKKEGRLGDVDKLDSFLFMLGLTPSHIDDTFLKGEYMKHKKTYQEEGIRDATAEVKRALKAAYDGDDHNYETYLRRAGKIAERDGLTQAQRRTVFDRAVLGYESYYEQVQKRWWEMKEGLK
jgi:hypothetical protein